MSTIIKNAMVVLPHETSRTNVLIEGQKIAAIDSAIHTSAVETIDARGLYLIPGLIDDQVHFREPGLTHKEDFAHATRACAKGGVTNFLEMPNTIPHTTTQRRLEEKLELARRTCIVNYGFYIGATLDNIDQLQAAHRTPGIKVFMGSSTGDLLVDNQAALERIFAETTLPICAHCEDESTIRANAKRYQGRGDVPVHSLIRDRAAAVIATRRAVDLALRHKHPFHVLHVSTADEIPVIHAAADYVTCEVCPHHLFFNIDDYAQLGSLIQMNPAVKTSDDNQALWLALLDEKIQVIATDHAPHTLEEKRRPYPDSPSGLPSVENSLALMLNRINQGKCTIEQLVNWMCVQPARIWRMGNKGQIRVGNDADLVLVDLNCQRTVYNETQQTKCRWSPWHGTTLQGWAVKTWVMGRLVYQFDRGVETFANINNTGLEIQFGSFGT